MICYRGILGTWFELYIEYGGKQHLEELGHRLTLIWYMDPAVMVMVFNQFKMRI